MLLADTTFDYLLNIGELIATCTLASVLVALVTKIVPEWQKEAREERMQIAAAAAADRENFRDSLKEQCDQHCKSLTSLADELHQTRQSMTDESHKTRSELTTAIEGLTREIHNDLAARRGRAGE